MPFDIKNIADVALVGETVTAVEELLLLDDGIALLTEDDDNIVL